MRAVRRVGAAAVALAVVGGGYAAYAAAAEPAAAYRTATVTVADVQETLSLSGTLAPAGRADLAFGSDGTVAALTATSGSTVEAGEVLARLDTGALRRAVRDAESDVAAAKAQLESDEDAQAETVSDATSTSTDTAQQQSQQSQQTQQPTEQESEEPTEQESEEPTQQENEEPTSSAPDVTAVMATALADLATQQDAVTTAQSAASSAIADAKQALAAQTTTCENAFQADPVTDPEPSDGATDAPAETPAAEADPADAACTAALGKVQDAQDTVATAQDVLQTALGTLSGTLSAAVETLSAAVQSASTATGDTGDTGSTGGSDDQESSTPTQQSTQQSTQEGTQQATPTQQSSATGGSTGTSSSSTSGSSGSSTGMTQTVTAATLARDQATIEEARVALITARQSLAAATLKAPYAGTVVDVATEKGAATTAGTTVVTVIAHGTTTVEVAATEAQVRQLGTGQAAAVLPAGAEEEVAGEVTAIGAVPDTSTGSTTYPVTVTLDGTDLGLPTGATASVAVVVGTADDVLTVPTSAISSGSVVLVDGTTATRTPVGTGIVGSTRTEVTSGLEAGDEVSLADLTAALPSADTSTETSVGGGLTGGTGGFGGGTGGGMPMRPGG